MGLAEKFPRGFPEREGLHLLRVEDYSPDLASQTAERLMTSLYNLIFYHPKDDSLSFPQDEDTRVLTEGYEEEEEFGGTVGISLKTVHVYFTSRRNSDGTLRDKQRLTISAFIEFHQPMHPSDVWSNTVFAEPISRAAIYVTSDLKMQAETAFKIIDKLRLKEPVQLEEYFPIKDSLTSGDGHQKH